MFISADLTPFIPWFVVAASFLVGIALSYVCGWIARLTERRGWRGSSFFAALRNAIVFYALAAGLSFAPFDFAPQSKRELQMDRLVVALIIIATTMVISRLMVRFVQAIGRRHGDRFPSASLFASAAQITTIILGALILLQSLNIAIAPILTALGVGGLAVALALQDTLSNLFAGIQIIAAHQVRPGDYIKLDSGNEGYVADITWRNTTIRELGNNLVVVPNSKIASSIFTNYSRPEQRTIVSVDVIVGFGEDLRQVERFALETARAVTKEIKAPDEEPFVRFRQLADSGLTMSTFFSVARFDDQFKARSLFIERFYTKSGGEGVFIPRQPWAEKPPTSSPTPAAGNA